MSLTPERRAQISARVDAIVNKRPRAKVVTSEGEAIRDADVHVSRADPNASGKDETIAVRRADWVTINLVAYERQRADEAAEREYRRRLDPYKLGLYGPIDDDD